MSDLFEKNRKINDLLETMQQVDGYDQGEEEVSSHEKKNIDKNYEILVPYFDIYGNSMNHRVDENNNRKDDGKVVDNKKKYRNQDYIPLVKIPNYIIPANDLSLVQLYGRCYLVHKLSFGRTVTDSSTTLA